MGPAAEAVGPASRTALSQRRPGPCRADRWSKDGCAARTGLRPTAASRSSCSRR